MGTGIRVKGKASYIGMGKDIRVKGKASYRGMGKDIRVKGNPSYRGMGKSVKCLFLTTKCAPSRRIVKVYMIRFEFKTSPFYFETAIIFKVLKLNLSFSF